MKTSDLLGQGQVWHLGYDFNKHDSLLSWFKLEIGMQKYAKSSDYNDSLEIK